MHRFFPDLSPGCLFFIPSGFPRHALTPIGREFVWQDALLWKESIPSPFPAFLFPEEVWPKRERREVKIEE